MAGTYPLIAIAIVWLSASPAFAADAANGFDLKSPNIQFGIPKNMTLEQARKNAHAKADTLDKMTPEQWDAGQKNFRDQMDRISKLPPEEQQRLFPGVPPEILSHMGRIGQPPAGQPKLTPAESLAKAQKNAHASADRFDKMTEQEWSERVNRNQEAISKYKAMKEEQDKRAMLNRLVRQQPTGAQAAPATLGQSKIPANSKTDGSGQ